MAFLEVTNGKIYYEVHGQGEPLFLIAGFSADHLIWQTILDPLAKKYQVIILDNRGVGRSETTTEKLTIELFAQDVLAIADTLDIERFRVIGNSMGGMISQQLMRMAPQRVITAVLSNSMMTIDLKLSLFAEGMSEIMKTSAPPEAMVKAQIVWAYSTRFLSNPKNLNLIMTLILTNPYPMTAENYKKQLDALNAFDSQSWLSTIETPTLVLGSKIDMIVTEAHTHEMAELLPNSECYIFENEAHLPSIENPKLFLEVVESFFANR